MKCKMRPSQHSENFTSTSSQLHMVTRYYITSLSSALRVLVIEALTIRRHGLQLGLVKICGVHLIGLISIGNGVRECVGIIDLVIGFALGFDLAAVILAGLEPPMWPIRFRRFLGDFFGDPFFSFFFLGC